MANRRAALLDAAIDVVGQSGIHGLTHRAVDIAAGLPGGSASNHFRTRDALLNAVAERFAARERANWEQIAVEIYPATPAELALALARFAQDAAGPDRTLALARYSILVEAANCPPLRDRLTVTGRCSGPRIVVVLRSLTGPASARSGIRSASIRSAIVASSRASGWPRQ